MPKATTTARRRCARRLPTQQCVTATIQRRDGRAVHVRRATRPVPRQQKINATLGLSPNPGGTHRVLIQRDLSGCFGNASGYTKVVPYAPNYVSNSLISLRVVLTRDKLWLAADPAIQ